MWGGRTVGKRRAEALARSLPEPRSSPASPAPGGSRLPGRVPLIPVRSLHLQLCPPVVVKAEAQLPLCCGS